MWKAETRTLNGCFVYSRRHSVGPIYLISPISLFLSVSSRSLLVKRRLVIGRKGHVG